MSPRVKFLKIRFTCLDNDERGVLDDIDEIELEESLVPGNIKSTTRS